MTANEMIKSKKELKRQTINRKNSAIFVTPTMKYPITIFRRSELFTLKAAKQLYKDLGKILLKGGQSQ